AFSGISWRGRRSFALAAVMAGGALGSGAGAATTAAVREQTSRMASRYMKASLSRSLPLSVLSALPARPGVGLPEPLPPPHPPRPPRPRLAHLQFNDGRELSPRRVAHDSQFALDDDRRQSVEALVALAPGKVDRPGPPVRQLQVSPSGPDRLKRLARPLRDLLRREGSHEFVLPFRPGPARRGRSGSAKPMRLAHLAARLRAVPRAP